MRNERLREGKNPVPEILSKGRNLNNRRAYAIELFAMRMTRFNIGEFCHPVFAIHPTMSQRLFIAVLVCARISFFRSQSRIPPVVETEPIRLTLPKGDILICPALLSFACRFYGASPIVFSTTFARARAYTHAPVRPCVRPFRKGASRLKYPSGLPAFRRRADIC